MAVRRYCVILRICFSNRDEYTYDGFYFELAENQISVNEIKDGDAESVLSIYKKYNKSPMLYFLKDDHLEIQYKTVYNIYQKEYIEQ